MKFVALRLVPKRFVAKKFVLVAEVVVELIAVKFSRVDELITQRLVRVVRPDTLRVPELVVFANEARPVKVGDAESTRLVVPVDPDTSESDATRLARVRVDVRFFEPSVATRRDAVRPEKFTVPDDVTPVSPVSVPAMVELPVIAAPPEETVSAPPIVAVLEVRSVPAEVFTSPTPRPPVR